MWFDINVSKWLNIILFTNKYRTTKLIQIHGIQLNMNRKSNKFLQKSTYSNCFKCIDNKYTLKIIIQNNHSFSNIVFDCLYNFILQQII